MADFVVPVVLNNLIKLVTYEANLLLGVQDQVGLLRDDLQFMNGFLEKSAGKRNDPLFKVLVDQIRDAALESEDVVDAYMARIIKQRMRNVLGKLFHSIGQASVQHSLSNKTSSIMNKIKNIYENKATYGIGEADEPSIDAEAEQSLQIRRRNVEEDDVVGFVKDTTTLVNQLTDRRNLQREVISIIGMGGLGKTTLARKIYNNSCVKNHFDCCAWISVSQEWQIERLLLDILKCFKQISNQTSSISEYDLKEKLCKHLKGKRYFVVMDDIWSNLVWEVVREAFPDDSNGSRILITSREREIASHATPTPPYFLPFLNDDESWELLRKKVFRGGECPSNLENLGRQLAKSCKGLPLSVVLLGGILANKEKSHRIWSRFIGNVNQHLTEGVSILTLSYNHLPRHLKPCFLYFGSFPEDSEMKVRELTKLWIAEGFIQPIRNVPVNDVAEEYLEQLIDRSLIQVARKRSDGGVKTCRIHDLLRDLCIGESIRDKFLEIYSNDNHSTISKSRRISFQHILKNSIVDLPCARSLFFIGCEITVIGSVLKQSCKCVKFIRVLYFSQANTVIIPWEIKELVFLRCLWIKGSSYIFLPSSIWKLRYLETIHFGDVIDNGFTTSICYNIELPKPSRMLMGDHFLNLQVLSWLVIE